MVSIHKLPYSSTGLSTSQDKRKTYDTSSKMTTTVDNNYHMSSFGGSKAKNSAASSFQKHNATVLAAKQMPSVLLPTNSQQEACLSEVHSFTQGNLPFLTTTPENPASARRPPAQHLEEKGLIAPGVARATQAASVEKPFGSSPDGPNYKKMGTNLRTVSVLFFN